MEELFSGLHKTCIRKTVRRAVKEKLVYDEGRSESLLRKFYDLLLRTRRRHGLPPQPFRWFSNLAESLGDCLKIRVADKDGRIVAAILTLSHKTTMTYKYGCSDERWNHLGGIPFLFWTTIQQARNEGMDQLDLGRSDLDNEGLIQFKDRLGAERVSLSYWRSPTTMAIHSNYLGIRRPFGRLVRLLPDRTLSLLGNVLYRHFG